MNTKVNLYKKVFDKNQVDNVIDSDFTELSTSNSSSFFDVSLATVDDFFILYNRLFYLIPKEGENSHTTIAQKSGDYVDFERINETISALIEEVTLLRQENIELINRKNEREISNIVNNINATARNT